MTKSDTPRTSILDAVAPTLPALLRAMKLQKQAATVGFDWDTPEPIFAKLTEEIDELKDVMAEKKPSQMRLTDELGDILFVVVNLARQLGIDSETALQSSNEKFVRRFRFIEAELGTRLTTASLAELEASWQRAKKRS